MSGNEWARQLKAVQREYDHAIDDGNIALANRIADANPDVITLEKRNPNPDYPDDGSLDEPEEGGEG